LTTLEVIVWYLGQTVGDVTNQVQKIHRVTWHGWVVALLYSCQSAALGWSYTCQYETVGYAGLTLEK